MRHKSESPQPEPYPYGHGYLRLACLSPSLAPADLAGNLAAILDGLALAARSGASLAVFPELCLSGYTCGDLFNQGLLLDAAKEALLRAAKVTGELGISALLGLPLALEGRLYNCAAFISEGRVLGLTPKIFLPTTNEYYEERWFTSGALAQEREAEIGGLAVPFGIDLLYRAKDLPNCLVGVEICEDLWAACPPSSQQALAGATLLLNPSASVELLGKASYRRDLVRQQSARCLAAYAYAGAGPGESTTDVVFSGHSLIAENGIVLAESERFAFSTSMILADLDLELLDAERRGNSSFSASKPRLAFRTIDFTARSSAAELQGALLRPLPATPFVPADPELRAANCREIFLIQSTALARRLKHTAIEKLVLGLSGGLDSCLALLAGVQAFERMGLPRANLLCFSLPGPGTTRRTKGNAARLAKALGVGFEVIPIARALRQHFKDIGQPDGLHDVTYENAQARERTQILMDIANLRGAMLLGTGDLSEAALGFCTYGGDHLSMYHINKGIPKTLIRYVIAWCAEEILSGQAKSAALGVLATPVSPELLPPAPDGSISQCTEEIIGPYLLHDFFLFHFLRRQAKPAKIVYLAERAFAGVYPKDVIVRWLKVFLQRFFAQQFKRSADPDGPKVGSVALSPRGDWRMPSDAVSALWLAELDKL